MSITKPVIWLSIRARIKKIPKHLFRLIDGLAFNTTLITIVLFRGGRILLVEEAGIPGENH